MDREEIAKDIYYDYFCGERGNGVSFKWGVAETEVKEKCYQLATDILENYTSKADHEAEIQGLELEIKLLKADEVWMKRKLKENVRLARVEVAREIQQDIFQENRNVHNKGMDIVKSVLKKLDKIIKANEKESDNSE